MKGIQSLILIMFLIFGLVHAADNEKNDKDAKKEDKEGNGKDDNKNSNSESSARGLGTSLLGLAAILAICLAK
ncbi:hypothetical protein EHEL_010425 [Encephalitozoon hellem ATCC 50504]|uniref:Uncharacterized protein n=1 Tax=Encephalitozoon hellem TaxID=27973 RepID=A0A9Q9C4F4_ENCHE|nr:uncharacterized protein EHEL_010425 [Encephalitozoon hellem ATCC 50504]AHL28902.1 hypothetical protein EHEL_010425 [Encephalitozoon hellem ATCC 50504]UTX42357.1 hypothetical protein GPU96_01g00590 [Encephalitozoon hellem]WEL37799.1 hypothetical protein PFJ87_01g00520 [Encephalitozoon hellem]